MTTPTNIRVGGEVDAHCNKCELNLAHTIIAMVGPKIAKVECLTCHTVHAYKGTQHLVAAQGFSRPRASSKAKVTKAEKVIISWETQLKGKDVAHAKKYGAKETYDVDDVVDHPTFGLGFVTAVRGTKIDVAFKADVKTLVHVPPVLPPLQMKKPGQKAFTPARHAPIKVVTNPVETEPVKTPEIDTNPIEDSPVKTESELEDEAEAGLVSEAAEAESDPSTEPTV